MDLVQISPSSNYPRIQAHQSMEVITAQVPATSPLFSNVLHNLGLGSFIPPDSSFMQKFNCGLLCVLSRYHLIILHVSLLYPFLSSPHTSSPPPSSPCPLRSLLSLLLPSSRAFHFSPRLLGILPSLLIPSHLTTSLQSTILWSFVYPSHYRISPSPPDPGGGLRLIEDLIVSSSSRGQISLLLKAQWMASYEIQVGKQTSIQRVLRSTSPPKGSSWNFSHLIIWVYSIPLKIGSKETLWTFLPPCYFPSRNSVGWRKGYRCFALHPSRLRLFDNRCYGII